MKVNNLTKVAMKNDFPRLRVEPGSLDPESNTLPTEPPRPVMSVMDVATLDCGCSEKRCNSS